MQPLPWAPAWELLHLCLGFLTLTFLGTLSWNVTELVTVLWSVHLLILASLPTGFPGLLSQWMVLFSIARAFLYQNRHDFIPKELLERLNYIDRLWHRDQKLQAQNLFLKSVVLIFYKWGNESLRQTTSSCLWVQWVMEALSTSESWSCLCQKISGPVFITGTKCKVWFLTHFSTHRICLNLFSIKFCGIYHSPECFLGSASGKEPTCQCRRLRDVDQTLGWEDSLEEGMATHSSILAWRISWTEESGRLQSMGSHRVGHDWSNLASTHRGIAGM